MMGTTQKGWWDAICSIRPRGVRPPWTSTAAAAAAPAAPALTLRCGAGPDPCACLRVLLLLMPLRPPRCRFIFTCAPLGPLAFALAFEAHINSHNAHAARADGMLCYKLMGDEAQSSVLRAQLGR
jgi:hypothetical protein